MTTHTPKMYIGIDPGIHTGVALWRSYPQKFEEIFTCGWWAAVDYIEARIADTPKLTLVVEDPEQNKPVFLQPGRPGPAELKKLQKVTQSVGMNKMLGRLIIERFDNRIEVVAVRPSGRKGTRRKIDAPAFARLTGWTARTSQHARDAAMMVFGL